MISLELVVAVLTLGIVEGRQVAVDRKKKHTLQINPATHGPLR